jgi:glycosyltransferase involved in cell wall biosynthesis
VTGEGNQPRASVIVPTRNGEARLGNCLRALKYQRKMVPDLEVIVVDDGSENQGALAEVTAREGARLVRQAASGAGSARNLGARAARAPILCFTDDDCVPEEGWVARLVSRIDQGADVVAGPTLVGSPLDRLAFAHQLISNSLSPPDYIGDTFFAPTSNFACRAAVIEAVPFDPAYDRWAGVGAEDRDWFARAGQAGVRFAFEPAAIVRHHPEMSFPGFIKKQVRYGRGAFRYRQRHHDGQLNDTGFYAALVRRGFEAGPTVGLLVCLAQAATAAGYTLEAFRNRGPVSSARPPQE